MPITSSPAITALMMAAVLALARLFSVSSPNDQPSSHSASICACREGRIRNRASPMNRTEPKARNAMSMPVASESKTAMNAVISVSV